MLRRGEGIVRKKKDELPDCGRLILGTKGKLCNMFESMFDIYARFFVDWIYLPKFSFSYYRGSGRSLLSALGTVEQGDGVKREKVYKIVR